MSELFTGGASGGAAGAVGGGLLSAASPLGFLSSGLGILQGVGGLFGSKTKVSSAASYSGIGSSSPTNTSSYNKAAVDLENPVHVLVLGCLIIGSIYAYRKIK